VQIKEIEIIAKAIMTPDPKDKNLRLIIILGMVGLDTCIIGIFYS